MDREILVERISCMLAELGERNLRIVYQFVLHLVI